MTRVVIRGIRDLWKATWSWGRPRTADHILKTAYQEYFLVSRNVSFFRDRVCHYVALAGLELTLEDPIASASSAVMNHAYPPRPGTGFLNGSSQMVLANPLPGGATPPQTFRPNVSIFTWHPESTSIRRGNGSALPSRFFLLLQAATSMSY